MRKCKSLFMYAVAIVAMLTLGGATLQGAEWIELSVGIVKITPGIPGHGKNPSMPPEVYLDDHQIFFQDIHPQYTLIIEQEGQVVWSTVVTTSMTSVMLPAWLTGDATLLLIPDDSIYYYYGDITL